MKRSINKKHYILKDINPVIRLLIISDAFIQGGAGLLGPIFALFVEDFITGGNAAVAGTAAAIFLVTRSLLQIPLATVIDKIRGEKDDYYFMVIGSIIASLIPLSYLFISTATGLYITQFFLGIAQALTYPSYMAIFTHHIDNHKEGTEWGVYYTLTDLTMAAMASIGGYMATSVGFHAVILWVTGISFIGALILIPLKPFLQNK